MYYLMGRGARASSGAASHEPVSDSLFAFSLTLEGLDDLPVKNLDNLIHLPCPSVALSWWTASCRYVEPAPWQRLAAYAKEHELPGCRCVSRDASTRGVKQRHDSLTPVPYF